MMRRGLPSILLLSVLPGFEPGLATHIFPEPITEVGQLPNYVAAADLNGDGKEDLVTANFGSNDVSVLLSEGDGSFGLQTRYAAADGPFWIAIGDLDGDGTPDLAVANFYSDRVSILHGRGDGTFDPQTQLITGDGPASVAIADLTGDGRPDLAVASAARVAIYPGESGGALGAAQVVDGGTMTIAAGDVTGEGMADLLVAGYSSVQVVYSNGAPVMGPVMPTGENPAFIQIEDLNRDGARDIVTANVQTNDVSVLLGAGGGAFQPERRFRVGRQPWTLKIGDFNEDGSPDIVAMNSGGFGTTKPDLSLLAGHGDGTFDPQRRSPMAGLSYSIVTGDFDKDGHQDLVSANYGSHDLSVMRGKGDGTFGLQGWLVPTVLDPGNLAVGDLNGDGIEDLAVPIRGVYPSSVGGVSIFLGRGDGSFTQRSGLVVDSNPHSVVMGDLNADGVLDLVVATTGVCSSPALPCTLFIHPSDVRVFIGAGDGAFTPASTFDVRSGGGATLLEDVDGAGSLDLLRVRFGATSFTPGAVGIRPGIGDGTFGTEQRFSVGILPSQIVGGDFNGDGRTDVAAADRVGRVSLSEVSVLLGHGDGTFEPEHVTAIDGYTPALAAADFDEDGRTDLAITSYSSTSPDPLQILLSRGDGTFLPGPVASELLGYSGLVAGDFDGDAHQDLVVTGTNPQGGVELRLVRGDGRGTMKLPLRSRGPVPIALVSAADFNRDGRPDLAMPVKGGVQILLNEGPLPNQPPAAFARAAATTECTSPAGAQVLLDGSDSTDPDSTAGTHDDIVSYSWFEGYGTPAETLVGTGETVTVILPLGPHEITLRVTDTAGATATAEVVAAVVDTTPPVLTLSLTPAVLWPPNHRMVEVTATVDAEDLCGATSWALMSITSSEPDDAPGGADGATMNDIEGAVAGTSDAAFGLRAERAGTGPGRTYTVTYSATDAAGLGASVHRAVTVPHDQGGVTDPLAVSVRQSAAGTIVSWRFLGMRSTPNPVSYNVARGVLSNLRATGRAIDLGPVICIVAGSRDTSTLGHEDGEMPPPREAFFYLVEYDDGQAPSSLGEESAGVPRAHSSGGCR